MLVRLDSCVRRNDEENAAMTRCSAKSSIGGLRHCQFIYKALENTTTESLFLVHHSLMRIVQKFGGTSVGSIERINHVADRIKQWSLGGHQIAVVVSAMSGETNRLLALSEAISRSPSLREQDNLVATGELVSMSLLAIALQEKGIAAQSFSGWQAGVKTSKHHSKARIREFHCERIEDALEQGTVAIMAGFQGINKVGDITTLGRGGSDTSAVALAAAVQADECQIYTDVDGIYTTDPRIVKSASRLNTITFEEILEMASLGAKVLQIRSVELAFKKQVPLRVLSSLLPCTEKTLDNPGGTLITVDAQVNAKVNVQADATIPKGKPQKTASVSSSSPHGAPSIPLSFSTQPSFQPSVAMENRLISGVAFNRDEAQIRFKKVNDQPGIAYAILHKIAEANIEVDMIIQNISEDGYTDFTFTVHRNDFDEAMTICQQSKDQLQAEAVTGNDRIVKVSLVGVGMRSHAGIASEMFRALKEANINILMISTSEIKISVCIDEQHLETATQVLHEAFQLDKIN